MLCRKICEYTWSEKSTICSLILGQGISLAFVVDSLFHIMTNSYDKYNDYKSYEAELVMGSVISSVFWGCFCIYCIGTIKQAKEALKKDYVHIPSFFNSSRAPYILITPPQEEEERETSCGEDIV